MPNKPELREISDEEEARIQKGIAADLDNPEWTEEDFARAKPFSETHPELYASWKKTRGRQKAPTKVSVGMRLSPDVVAHYRATGPGWQVRVDEILRKAAKL